MSHVDDGVLHALLDGQLDALGPDRAHSAREHVETCATCQERLEAERELRQHATALFERHDPLEGVELPTLAALRREAAGDDAGSEGAGDKSAQMEAGRTPPRRRRAIPTWVPVGWAATVILSLGVGYGIGVVGRERTPTSPAVDGAGSGFPSVGADAAGDAASDAEGARSPSEAGAAPRAVARREGDRAELAEAPRERDGTERAEASGEADLTDVLGRVGLADADRGAETATAAPATDEAVDEVDALDEVDAVAGTAAAAESRRAIPEPATQRPALRLPAPPSLLPELQARSDPAAAADRRERAGADVLIAPTTFELADAVQAPRFSPAASNAADEDTAVPLVVPGLRVVEVVSEEVWAGQQGVRFVQAFPDGRQLELRVAGPPVAGDGAVRPPPAEAGALPAGWARSTRSLGGGWAELRGPLSQPELEALLARLAGAR